jgi:uncharacterized protein DUF1707
MVMADHEAVVSVRCSTAEREQTSALLHAAVGEGRLTLDEVEDRLQQVYAARYRHELAALTADLPGSPTSTGLTTAWQRFVADVTRLLGRIGVRRGALVVLLIAAAMLMMAAHGFGEHDFHGHG